MKTRLYDSILSIDPERWDALGTDPLSRHAVLAALEAASMDGLRMRYAVLEDAAGWIAAAPFARIPIDAGRLTHGAFRNLIGAVRRVDPGFMRTSLTICGTPLSVGNPPARIGASVDHEIVYRHLAGLLQEIATEERSPWRAFKEIDAADLVRAQNALRPAGWIVAPSETNHHLTIRWNSFEAYLAAMRSAYRSKILQEQDSLARAGVRTSIVPLAGAYDDRTHRLYEAVVDRAAVQLERLTPAFFVALGRAYPAQSFLIRMERDGRLIGWVATLVDGDTAFDLFHGIDDEESHSIPVYFGQLAALIRFAIDRSVRRLSLGQSTSVAKARFGAEGIGLWMAVRHELAAANAFLRAGARYLFPAPEKPERHVFAFREPDIPHSPERAEALRCATDSWSTRPPAASGLTPWLS
jgi:predicted N-acyltransferase